MAQRFGGAHSPGKTRNSFQGRRPHPAGMRVNLMFLLPIPILIGGLSAVFAGDVMRAGEKLGAFALLLLGAWLLREGVKAKAAFEGRRVARAPAIPRMLFAAAAAGLGVFVAGFSAVGLIPAVLFGGLAVGAHIITFGIDPLKKKGLTGFDEYEADRVARAVERGEAVVSEILDAAKRIRDRHLQDRVQRLANSARELFRTVEADPRDMSRARKYMGIYLVGARDATIKYAELGDHGTAEARTDYEALLSDLESSFETQREKLLLDERTDLDVEIEVLRERLQREGA